MPLLQQEIDLFAHLLQRAHRQLVEGTPQLLFINRAFHVTGHLALVDNLDGGKCTNLQLLNQLLVFLDIDPPQEKLTAILLDETLQEG